MNQCPGLIIIIGQLFIVSTRLDYSFSPIKKMVV